MEDKRLTSTAAGRNEMLLTKLKSSEIPWGLLSLEAILIVLSVLLALGVDSWREAREQQTLAERALQGFIDEAQANCENIRATEEYHRAVVEGNRPPEGMRVGLLRNDAWEVVKTTGAAGWLDYDLVAAMSEISAGQRDHRATMQAYLQAVFTLGLPTEDASSWHLPGERAVINELLRIQSLDSSPNIIIFHPPVQESRQTALDPARRTAGVRSAFLC
ncbi:MAG: hypothetical protein ABR550_00800 [Wenzhouxiangellaceae bacterium]